MARVGSRVDEAILKASLCQEARAQLKRFVVIRHEDRFTHGIPDMSVTGNKTTSWWEVKHALSINGREPDFESKGIQELTMRRLALAGRAAYVVYWERGLEHRTYILQVGDLGNPNWAEDVPHVDGFNHNFVIDYIKEVHSDCQ
jgi:hypothetical protein